MLKKKKKKDSEKKVTAFAQNSSLASPEPQPFREGSNTSNYLQPDKGTSTKIHETLERRKKVLKRQE